jgi:hypothetical protein
MGHPITYSSVSLSNPLDDVKGSSSHRSWGRVVQLHPEPCLYANSSVPSIVLIRLFVASASTMTLHLGRTDLSSVSPSQTPTLKVVLGIGRVEPPPPESPVPNQRGYSPRHPLPRRGFLNPQWLLARPCPRRHVPLELLSPLIQHQISHFSTGALTHLCLVLNPRPVQPIPAATLDKAMCVLTTMYLSLLLLFLSISISTSEPVWLEGIIQSGALLRWRFTTCPVLA